MGLWNNAGGILGGISTGQDIVVSIAIKPTSSIRLSRQTIDIEGHATTVETHGRHDPCVGIRATPIAEAFLALVLIDHALRHRAQNGDVVSAVAAIPAGTGNWAPAFAGVTNASGNWAPAYAGVTNAAGPQLPTLEDPDPNEA